jgi:hypothetical protein
MHNCPGFSRRPAHHANGRQQDAEAIKKLLEGHYKAEGGKVRSSTMIAEP